MASNIKLQTTLRNAMVDAITTAIGTSGKLKIYDGTQPATVATSITTQNVLAVLPLSSAFAAGASSGVLTASAITNDSSADASGTATWFSVTKSDDTRIYEGSVGTSGADLNLNTTSIVAAGPVAVSSFTVTAPG